MSRLTVKAEAIEIDPDRAVAVGIIVNELDDERGENTPIPTAPARSMSS